MHMMMREMDRTATNVEHPASSPFQVILKHEMVPVYGATAGVRTNLASTMGWRSYILRVRTY